MTAGYGTQRKDIRDNIVSLLTGNTNALANVFSSRAESLFPEETSAINVYTTNDAPKLNKKFDWNYAREVTVGIEILVRKTDANSIPADEADIIAGQVENRILPNIHLQVPPPTAIQKAGGEGTPGTDIINYIELVDLITGITPEGLVDVYGIQIELRAEYDYNKAQGTLDPFVTANIHYDLEGQQAVVDQAEDEITLPQP